MAHEEQQLFCMSVRQQFPQYFSNRKVLDCGSLDINGNNRILFDHCLYTGIDVGLGRNVNIVCPTHEFMDKDGFDVIISTECFEHDMYYEQSLQRIVYLLRLVASSYLLVLQPVASHMELSQVLQKIHHSQLRFQNGNLTIKT